jgi:hemerythrin-like metal-binding protein
MVFFDIAAQWHQIYALSIDMKVECGEACLAESEEAATETACYLGRWMDGQGKAFADYPSYQALSVEHAHFHATAARMLLEHGRGNHEVAEQIRQGAYRATSAAVIVAIDALASDIGLAERGTREAPAVSAEIQEFCALCATPLGIPVLDQQHALLTGLAKVLLRDPAGTLQASHVKELLAEITSAVELHFDTEEAYMRKVGLPQSSYTRHVGEHEKILEALSRISAHAADLKTVGVADLLGYLRRWFGGHLMDSDFEIKRYAAR